MRSSGSGGAGPGVDSAQQIIAEVGSTAATFPSEKQLSSWVGTCPGDEESAGVNSATDLRRATAHAAHSQPNGQRRRGGRKEASSTLSIAARSRAWDIIKPSGHCPSTVSPDLANPAPGSRYEERVPPSTTVEAKAHLEDDPATSKPWAIESSHQILNNPVKHKAVIFDPDGKSDCARAHGPALHPHATSTISSHFPFVATQ